jgi:DNA-binding MarR family transcriptional regulator
MRTPDQPLVTSVRALMRGARLLEVALGDMSLAQLRVLTLIDLAPERASALAEKAAVSRPSLSGVLDGLEARGWVRRVDVDGDRRGVGLEMTKEGRAALRAAERSAVSRLEAVLDELDDHGRASAIAGLAAFDAAIKARGLAQR